MFEEFTNWTDYDHWLTQHYEEFAIVSLIEKDGKIRVEFVDKQEWDKAHR